MGNRAFAIPLDDIGYTRWNWEGDRVAFGEPGRAAAARAQVHLLSDVQRIFIATHEGAQPLQMVPTEYGDLTDTAYKQTMRDTLDLAVEVMWTGTDVVPPKITNEGADKASKLFGRKVFVWDNYPVNDLGNTSGRLLLVLYVKHQAGLSSHLSGVVANPMNQPYASKVAVFGTADFTWNDRAYDARTNGPRAMAYLTAGDPKATDALLVFGDLEHMAPTFGAPPGSLGTRTRPARRGILQGVGRGEPRRSRQGDAWLRGRHRTGPGHHPRRSRGGGLHRRREALAGRHRAVGQGDGDDAGPLEAWQARHNEKADQLLAESNDLQQRARAIRVDPARNNWRSG
ncbi:beta-N-acetylglucosaminidase domain-containing protein [Streptomyces sp. NPDC056352]|uniref:beta-N-acetylglucosaminidase domain-containing protein n=1 Tax=Streptomyces sp. NPDC056352 TaxID=3345791 RepID=UPI0035DBEE04